MSAMARELPDAAMDETIHHEPAPHYGPEGDDPMTTTPDKAAHRYTYASGARPLDGFTIKRAIGRGGFGEVYYATSDAGKEVAIKLITRNLEIERRGVVQCMNLKSPHLVAIHDLKQNDDGDSFVVMEYVAGPSLAQILLQHPAGLPPAEIRMWLKGLVEGVAYLHDHGIVHRDLKPANLFLEEGVVKIGDYGLSKAITTQSREPGHSECVGTCHYMAPETSTGKYHKPIDVYAIGVILHEMVTGRVPFDGESVGEVLMKHLTSRPDLSILPEPFKGIVARALAKDPNHRPARVTDLLLPGDAPKELAVRFIGDKSWPPDGPAPLASKAATPPKEDILRIEAEEPVFYIGPDTRPARGAAKGRPLAFNQWLWGRSPARKAVQVKRASLRPTPPPAPAPAPPRPQPINTRLEPREKPAPRPAVAPRPAPAPPPAPEPLGPPPPLPSTRVRLAELAGSMVVAAPTAAIASALALPLVSLAGDGDRLDPRLMGVVFGTTLLASWCMLIVGKVGEGQARSKLRRQAVMLGFGALTGLAGFGLWVGTHLGPIAEGGLLRDLFGPGPTVSGWKLDAAAQFAACFAAAFAVFPWWTALGRDRRRRLRVWPIGLAALVMAPLSLGFPATVPVAALAMPLAAFVAQLSSPWSRAAANYRLESRRRGVRAA